MKIPKLIQKQRWVIYQLLEREFWKRTRKCLELSDGEMAEDRYCGMGLFEFVCDRFVLLGDEEFNKIIKNHEKS